MRIDNRIAYEGFVVEGRNRVYSFVVTDGPGLFRKFTVKVHFEAVRSTALNYQDGPPICFEFLKQELDGEAEGPPANASLDICAEDIQEYLGRHFPRKRS